VRSARLADAGDANFTRDVAIRTARAHRVIESPCGDDGCGTVEVVYNDFSPQSGATSRLMDAVFAKRLVLIVGGEEYVALDIALPEPVVTEMSIVLEFDSPDDTSLVVGDQSYEDILRAELARRLAIDASYINNLSVRGCMEGGCGRMKDTSDRTVLVTFDYVASTTNGAAAIEHTLESLELLQNDPAVTLNLGNVAASPSLQIAYSTTEGPKTKTDNSGNMETWQLVLIVVFCVIAVLLCCCIFICCFFRRLETREEKLQTTLQTETYEQNGKGRAESIRERLQSEMEQEDLEAWWGSGSGGGVMGANPNSNTTLWDEDGMAPADASVHVLEQNRGMANPHYFPKSSNNEINESQVWVKQSPAGHVPTAKHNNRGGSYISRGAPPRVASFKASLSLPRGQPHFYPSSSPADRDVGMPPQADNGWFNWDPDRDSPQQSPTLHVDRQLEMATLAALEPVPRPEFDDAMDVERAQRQSFARGPSVRSEGYLDDIVGDRGDGDIGIDEFNVVNSALREQHEWGAPPPTAGGPPMSDEFTAATSALRALSPPSRPNLNSVRSARTQSRGAGFEGQPADEFEFVGAAVMDGAQGRDNDADWAGNPVPLGQRSRRASTPPPDQSGTINALPYLDGKVHFHNDDDGEPMVQQP